MTDLLRCTIPGPPANKKNTPIPGWPWIQRQRLRLNGKPVRGLADFLRFVALTRRYDLLLSSAKGLRPVIFPNAAFRTWEKSAKRAIQSITGGLTLAEAGTPLILECKFYLAPRQRPDLAGLLEAACDALESSGAIPSDYWINGFGDSKRVWPPSGSTKAIKLAREAWQPKTVMVLSTKEVGAGQKWSTEGATVIQGGRKLPQEEL